MKPVSKTRLYKIWCLMKSRCLNRNISDYKYYGGRGIGVHNSWLSFSGFQKDMSSSYTEHCNAFGEKQTTIDRINNKDGYSKENCRWATRKEQARNSSMAVQVTVDARTQFLNEWAKELEVDTGTITKRSKSLGISLCEAIKMGNKEEYRVNRKKNCVVCGKTFQSYGKQIYCGTILSKSGCAYNLYCNRRRKYSSREWRERVQQP